MGLNLVLILGKITIITLNFESIKTWDYMGSITIGNGLDLKITHIGIVMIKTNDEKQLPLINTLYVPQLKFMSRNLDCKFIFDGKNFTIKDNKTNCVILNGSGSNGPYHLNHTSYNSNHHIATIAKRSCELQT